MAPQLPFNPILAGVLVPLHFGWWRVKIPYPPNSLTFEIIHPVDLKLWARNYRNKIFLKMPKRIRPLSRFRWRQHFFYDKDRFPGKLRFFKISALIWWKSCLWGYVRTNLMSFKFYKVIILITTVYIHKKVDFEKPINRLITFAFSVTPFEQCGRGRPYPDMTF